MPVTAPPLKATSSAGAMPPRAASATRVFARTETFMPMKPAAAERLPPIRNPIAVFTSRPIAITIARITATTPIVSRYWRVR